MKENNNISKKTFKTERLVKISILSAIAYVVMMIEFPIPIFPEFLKIDLSDIPALLGAFSMGPVAGVIIELIKNILHAFMTRSAGIGELANFIVGAALVFTSGIIYRRNKTKKNAIFSLFIGTIVMGIAAGIANYFILIPLYEKVLLFPVSAMVDMASKVTSLVTNLGTLVLFSIVPFTVLKGTIVSIIVFFMYKRIEPIIKSK